MKNVYSIPLLLKSGALDIRGAATKNPSMSVEEYFFKLDLFLETAPFVAERLAAVLGFGGDSEPLPIQELVALRDLLSNIGGNKLASSIDDILSAEKSYNKALVKYCALSISNEISKICKRIKSAVTNKELSADNPAYEETSLKVMLDEVDRSEDERKLRILAVDDSSIMLNTLSTILDGNYELFALTRGDQVWRFLTHTTPDLFLLDIVMPEVSGYDLVPIIRGFKEHSSTPIIFLTGNATPEYLSTAISLGACDFVTKPVNPEILQKKITKWITKKKAY